MIDITTHSQASELISLSDAYLEQNESENNYPLGLAYKFAKYPHKPDSEPPLLLSILEHGKVVGVAIVMQRWKMFLSRISTEVQNVIVHLVHHLREIDAHVPSVQGPTAEAQAFSDCWIEGMSYVSSAMEMRLRLFEAIAVTELPLSPGQLRLAHMDDHSLMARWDAAYLEETFGKPWDFDFVKSYAERGIKEQELYIWEHGGPVSIVRTDRPTKNGIAIHTVYTPPKHRNKGYATSSVLTLTKKLLSERYSFCCLTTDLANPTSNSIYAKIGYVPVGDALSFDFVYTE